MGSSSFIRSAPVIALVIFCTVSIISGAQPTFSTAYSTKTGDRSFPWHRVGNTLVAPNDEALLQVLFAESGLYSGNANWLCGSITTPSNPQVFVAQTGRSQNAVSRARGKAFETNRALGRGINLGNALEAPREGEWGIVLQPEYFRLIKDAGFQTIRVPIRWSAHAAETPPYSIDPQFFNRIDWVLEQAQNCQLNVILNMHHYNELDREPQQHAARFFALWSQIAQRYRNQPDTVLFELYNEPHDKLIDEVWNETLAEALRIVRSTNPQRIVVVGPPYWNGIWALPKLRLPDDPYLIVTVHYYEPFEFTHQGASWAPERVARRTGVPWLGTPEELSKLRKSFDDAATWSEQQGRPIFLGEFGAYEKADMESRVRWTAAVVREAESRGFSWAYWEFAAGFGVYDRQHGTWREPLRNALLGTPPPANRLPGR